jgi:hypothetical protein
MTTTAKPTPADSAARKFGGQMGDTSLKILNDLHAHGKSNRLDIEMRIGITKLGVRLNTLANNGYVSKICDTAFTGHAITNRGRMAIGVLVGVTVTPKPIRICNASMRGTFNPATDAGMGRIGLAMCGAAGR